MEALMLIAVLLAVYIAVQEFRKWRKGNDDDHNGEGGYGVHTFA